MFVGLYGTVQFKFGLKDRVIELECKKVVFYSPSDESAFFAWAESIPAVSSVSGRGRRILLAVDSRKISEESLRELLALFWRYSVSMKQLARFQNSRNASWFHATDAFWFTRVFGAGRPSRSRRRPKAGRA